MLVPPSVVDVTCKLKSSSFLRGGRLRTVLPLAVAPAMEDFRAVSAALGDEECPHAARG